MNLSQLSEKLGRSALWVGRVQKKLGLPVLKDYPAFYLAFLTKIRDLQNLGLSDERISAFWKMERKLIEVLHLDLGTGILSLLEGCSVEVDLQHRLLLSNADLGVPIMALDLQTGLDFQSHPKELFGGQDMGEDAQRILREYSDLIDKTMKAVDRESKVLKSSLHWAKSVGFQPRHKKALG